MPSFVWNWFVMYTLYTATISLKTLKFMPRNLNEIKRSWIRLQFNSYSLVRHWWCFSLLQEWCCSLCCLFCVWHWCSFPLDVFICGRPHTVVLSARAHVVFSIWGLRMLFSVSDLTNLVVCVKRDVLFDAVVPCARFWIVFSTVEMTFLFCVSDLWCSLRSSEVLLCGTPAIVVLRVRNLTGSLPVSDLMLLSYNLVLLCVRPDV